MSGPFVFSRRHFLRQSGAFGALALAQSLPSLGLSSASAQAPGYRALVCVYLFGGNDADNTVLPYTNYAQYAAVRTAGNSPFWIPQNVATGGRNPMLQITPAGGSTVYGLHPNMPGLANLFASNRMAIVANMGPLVEPMTRATYRDGSKKRPDNLFSHSDQQTQTQTSISLASFGGISGWGGRLGDHCYTLNEPTATPMSMSFSGNQVFGRGESVRALSLPTAGNFGFSGDSLTPNAQQIARTTARLNILGAIENNAMVAATQRVSKAGVDASARLNPIIQGTGTSAVVNAFTGLNTSLSNQLRAIAKVIEQRISLGHTARQVFFASIGGFDTHTGQNPGHDNLLLQVSQAMTAFYNFTVAAGIANSVTSFTLSDFGRTFKSNGAGTDHAWGAHALVVGGAVNGGTMVGAYPTLALAGPDDSGSEGRWVPQISIEQYGATLGKWFGVSSTDLADVFPNLSRFPTADLGFMA
ncbi:MAG TPA: DUF1501 domain-containing protein [Casimicrobiaceae bacterium]|nr:DUF1501 domain-containing protein [Casimicrobiaceae bacterium]